VAKEVRFLRYAGHFIVEKRLIELFALRWREVELSQGRADLLGLGWSQNAGVGHPIGESFGPMIDRF
jgi:hypothetical protein